MLQIVDYKNYIEGGASNDYCFNSYHFLPKNDSRRDRIWQLPRGKAIWIRWLMILRISCRNSGQGCLTVDGTKNTRSLTAPELARLMKAPDDVELVSHTLEVMTSFGYVKEVNPADVKDVDISFDRLRKLVPCFECAGDVDALPLYQIVDYDENFENNKSRLRDRCSFVCVPNKHGGTGLSNLLSEPDNLSIYGFWMLLLQLCSRQRKPRLGYVTADGKIDGRRLGAAELARTFRASRAQVCRYLQVLESPEVGFLQLVDGEPESPETH